MHLRGRHCEPGVQAVPPVEAQRLLERVDGRAGSALTAEGQRGPTAQVALVGRCVRRESLSVPLPGLLADTQAERRRDLLGDPILEPRQLVLPEMVALAPVRHAVLHACELNGHVKACRLSSDDPGQNRVGLQGTAGLLNVG